MQGLLSIPEIQIQTQMKTQIQIKKKKDMRAIAWFDIKLNLLNETNIENKKGTN